MRIEIRLYTFFPKVHFIAAETFPILFYIRRFYKRITLQAQYLSLGMLRSILVKALINSIILFAPISLSGLKNLFVWQETPYNEHRFLFP